jgi:hypothetical protein
MIAFPITMAGFQTVLEVFASASASLFAIFEVYTLNKKMKAEARLLKVLRGNWETIDQLKTVNNIWEPKLSPRLIMLSSTWSDPEILKVATTEIETAVKTLSKSDRQTILEGLRQPSELVLTEHNAKLSPS